MYDENTFKNYIFWLKVKRIFLMLIFSIIGAFIGIVISQFLIDLLLVLDSSFKVIIIALSTLLFFTISLLLTVGTGKEIQEGYWKMAVLRKLTVISKKLDCLENLNISDNHSLEIVQNTAKEIKEELEKDISSNTANHNEISNENIKNTDDITNSETMESETNNKAANNLKISATPITKKKNINNLKINTKKISKKS